MKTKQELRREIQDICKTYSKAELKEKSTLLSQKIISNIMIQQGKHVACFIGTGNEPATLDLIEKLTEKGYSISLPRIISETQIGFFKIHHLSEFISGKYGILEPHHESKTETKIDVFLVPGVAFTVSGKRLGRGKGYYDKFLSQEQYKNTQKIGVCYDFQIVADIPTDEWDIKMGEVIY